MQLSPKKVKEFQSMYHARFGVQLSEEEARREGGTLVALLQTTINEYEQKNTSQQTR